MIEKELTSASIAFELNNIDRKDFTLTPAFWALRNKADDSINRPGTYEIRIIISEIQDECAKYIEVPQNDDSTKSTIAA